MMTDSKTYFKTTEAALSERKWVVVDANGQVVGRIASQIASILRGKNKPDFTPHVDCGDFVVVLNADKVVFTGRKLEQKNYYHHTGFPGGVISTSAGELMANKPERVIENAVKRMLPKTPLGRKQFGKLKVYVGGSHPHQAQGAQPLV